MRTIIFVLFSFILVLTLQQCNNSDDNLLTNKSQQIFIDTLYDDPLPCCNNGMYPNCNPPAYMSLKTVCGEIEITCECCQDIYAYYGYPHNLDGIEVPCFIPGISGCFPTKINE